MNNLAIWSRGRKLKQFSIDTISEFLLRCLNPKEVFSGCSFLGLNWCKIFRSKVIINSPTLTADAVRVRCWPSAKWDRFISCKTAPIRFSANTARPPFWDPFIADKIHVSIAVRSTLCQPLFSLSSGCYFRNLAHGVTDTEPPGTWKNSERYSRIPQMGRSRILTIVMIIIS